MDSNPDDVDSNPDEVRRPDAAMPDPAPEQARFDDPYWDDAFCAWWDPALRTCCG